MKRFGFAVFFVGWSALMIAVGAGITASRAQTAAAAPAMDKLSVVVSSKSGAAKFCVTVGGYPVFSFGSSGFGTQQAACQSVAPKNPSQVDYQGQWGPTPTVCLTLAPPVTAGEWLKLDHIVYQGTKYPWGGGSILAGGRACL